MIIIETKTGPCFVNEKAIESIEFDQDQEKVWVKSIDNNIPAIPTCTFSSVLGVRYISDAQPFDYIYEGQTIKNLKREAKEKEKELDRRLDELNEYANRLRRIVMKLYEVHPDIHDEIETIIKKEDESKNKISTKV